MSLFCGGEMALGIWTAIVAGLVAGYGIGKAIERLTKLLAEVPERKNVLEELAKLEDLEARAQKLARDAPQEREGEQPPDDEVKDWKQREQEIPNFHIQLLSKLLQSGLNIVTLPFR